MKVTKNGPFETNVYCGKVLITYAKDDEALCSNLFDRFIERGIKFEKNALDPSVLKDDEYQSTIYNTIADSACYVVAGSKKLFDNSDFVRLLMFQAGFAEDSIKLSKIQPNGIRQKVIFINVDENFDTIEAIKGTPYENSQNINKLVDVDSLIETLEKSFVLEKYDFYEDKRINGFVTSRIKFHKLSVDINLDIDTIKKFEPSLDETKIINRLKGITPAVKLLQFGYGVPDVEFFIFKNEYKIADEFKIFPNNAVSLKNRHVVTCFKDENNQIVKVVLSLDFIIPVHTPLGTTYKPFIVCNEMAFSLVRELLKADFERENTDEIDMFISDNRIFFNLDFKDDKLNLRETLEGYNVGKICNYCYAG